MQFMINAIVVALFISLVVIPVLSILGAWLQFYREVVLTTELPPKPAQKSPEPFEHEYTKAEAFALSIAIVAGISAIIMLGVHYA
jgi:hypothetical protein